MLHLYSISHDGLLGCHYFNASIRYQFPHIKSKLLHIPKKQDLLARRSPRITLHMHVGSLNCMHNRAHRANDHSAKAALASPSWAESEQPLGKWVSATNSSRGDSSKSSPLSLSVAYCIAAVHVQPIYHQQPVRRVSSPPTSPPPAPPVHSTPPSCATPPSS